MIKRELKINFKSFLLWTSILIGIFLVVFLVYPFIITDDSVKNLDEMMKVFPPEMLKMFNMDISSINTAYGWLKTEGFMFIMIIIGLYSSLLGLNVVLKEENDKTIEYLISLPITRKKILTDKILVGFIYILLITITIGGFNYISLIISGDINHKQYLLLSITPLLIACPLFAINLYISTYLHDMKKSIGFSLGMVFFFYIVNVLSELSEKVEFIKYFSIYTLADIRNVIESISINTTNILLSIVITIVFVIAAYSRYEKKELI